MSNLSMENQRETFKAKMYFKYCSEFVIQVGFYSIINPLLAPLKIEN